MNIKNIEAKVERSSLGTRQAKEARRTVPTAAAAKLVAHAQAERLSSEKRPPRSGG